MEDKNLPVIFEKLSQMADEVLFEPLSGYNRALPYLKAKEYFDSPNSVPISEFNIGKNNLLPFLEQLDLARDILVVAGSFYLLGRVIPILMSSTKGIEIFFSTFTPSYPS